MRILITGAAGFIGQNLARRLLEAGHAVAGVDALTPYYDVTLKQNRLRALNGYSDFAAHQFSIEDFERLSQLFADFGPTHVVHLAAQAGVRYSLEHPRAYVDTNVTGSFNVIELCKRHDVGHLLLASTSSAYGANTVYPFKETDRAAFPLTIYAATKLASELIAHSHSHLYDLPMTVLRFFTVYGPWGRPDMAPMLFAKAMFDGAPINVYNHGDMARDFTFVDDLTEAMARLLDRAPAKGQPVSDIDSLSPAAPYRLVNIGNGQPVPLMDFISALEKATGLEARRNMMDMQPGDVKRTWADSDLLEALTGYRPDTRVQTGVDAFIDWYRNYYDI